MGQFGQFGLNGFKRGQTHFSQLYISLDPDEGSRTIKKVQK